MNNSQILNAKEQSIVTISAFTAKGDLEQLRKALNKGLDAGLTVNEIKEVLVQLYAYCGFPRSLNGINTFTTVLEERTKKSIKDTEGKTATPVDEAGDKYERGRKTLETLTGQPQSKPAKGFGEFSPQIDRFLKEHLFADIFDSDVLTYRERELATISALAAMPGLETQLASHLSMGMNTCTVHLAGVATRSCILPVSLVGERHVVTIEGIGKDPVGRTVQDAWVENDVVQCGYCQSGQIMCAVALLKHTPKPTDTNIEESMGGNICRCGTYVRIREAIKTAAQRL